MAFPPVPPGDLPDEHADDMDGSPGEARPSRSAALRQEYGATLDAVAEVLREQARAWAQQLRLVQVLDDLTAMDPGVAPFWQLEMAGSWSVSQLTATRWQWEAERFAVALPTSLAMLERGELYEHQAKVLLHRTRNCSVEVARAVEVAVLPAGADLTPADLGRAVDRAVLRIESEQEGDAEQREADAAASRRTFSKPLPDAMGLAGAVLTAEQLVGWQQGMDALELRERRADREAGVQRTAEQRRADLFAALPALVLAGTAQDRASVPGSGLWNLAPTDGTGPAGGAGTPPSGLAPWTVGPEQLAAHIVLDVHVPVATVLDLSREPGTLDGYGPVSAEHVRLVRPRSWRRVLVDATSGRPIAVDDRLTPVDPDPERAREQVQAMLSPDVVADVAEPQHDPSARLARLVDLRDVRCCGPGCSATRTHKDHLVPHPHGPTSAGNLGRLSPRCHRAKHAGWVLVRHPDGSTTWTSPLGRVYDRPSPHAPPPRVDLDQELPPLHPRSRSALPADDDDSWTAVHHDRSGSRSDDRDLEQSLDRDVDLDVAPALDRDVDPPPF